MWVINCTGLNKKNDHWNIIASDTFKSNIQIKNRCQELQLEITSDSDVTCLTCAIYFGTAPDGPVGRDD